MVNLRGSALRAAISGRACKRCARRPFSTAASPSVRLALSTRTSGCFDTWRQDHPDAQLQDDVPGDYVTTTGSGLDPHITLRNAEFRLDRVAAKWAQNLKRDPAAVRKEIEQMLQAHAFSPSAGLFGEPVVNVLEMNLELRKRYGEFRNPGAAAIDAYRSKLIRPRGVPRDAPAW